MAEKKNPLGPTGDRVQANVRQLRDMRGLTYKELAERLTSIGRGIPLLGLSRIEQGERRVDADDLVALAIALGTTPARLLLPAGGDESEDVGLTPAVTVTAGEAWSWMKVDAPLAETRGEKVDIDDFERHSLPAFEQSWPHRRHTAVSAATDVLSRIWTVLEDECECEERKRAVPSLRRALTRLIAEIDDLIGDDNDGRR